MAGVKLGAWLLVAMAVSCIAVEAARSGKGSDRSDEITKIEFVHYFDDETTSKVFGPAPTENSMEVFGKGTVFDQPVSRGPGSERDEIGRARGLFFYESRNGDGVQDLFTVSFQRGEHAGSSITIGGHWNQEADRNVLAVTGGTGLFRYARGQAIYEEIRIKNNRRDQDVTAHYVSVELKDVSPPIEPAFL